MSRGIYENCLNANKGRAERILPNTEHVIQKQLALVCDYFGYEGISTHNFRKWYATEIYRNNNYDIALVQRLFAAHQFLFFNHMFRFFILLGCYSEVFV